MIGKRVSCKFAAAAVVWFFGCQHQAIIGQEQAGQKSAVLPLKSWPTGYHQQLRNWVDIAGKEHPIRTLGDWQSRRQQLWDGLAAVMGPRPSRDELPPLDVKVIARETRPLHERLTITFATESDERWTAYVFVPQGASAANKCPGILALHPTNAIGKGVTDGQSEAPNRAYGRELADLGYVVIAPDYPSFGDHRDYNFETDQYESGTMKGIMVHQRAIDILCARDDVDPNKLAAIGHSLGGHNAIFVGMFDERIKAIVTSCGWCPFPTYYEGKIAGWTSTRYMPRLKTVYELDVARVPIDFCEMISAIAPRAFFTCSPLHDSNFEVAGVRQAQPEIEHIFELYGVRDQVEFDYPDAQHDFPPDSRKRAYAFLQRVLN